MVVVETAKDFSAVKEMRATTTVTRSVVHREVKFIQRHCAIFFHFAFSEFFSSVILHKTTLSVSDEKRIEFAFFVDFAL